MDKLLAISMIGILTVLQGCTSLDAAGRTTAEAADKNFTIARWHYCEGQSIGAIKRNFGRNTEGLQNYLRGCGWFEEQVEIFYQE